MALVPWLWSLRQVDRRGAWKSGYLLGFLFGLGQLLWIGQLVERWTGSPALMLMVWLLCAVLFALYFGWAGVLVSKCWVRNQPWMIPLVWAGIEVCRSYIPVFAFPYALVASPLWRMPALIQTSFFGSIYLVSFWVVSVNLLVVFLIDRERSRSRWIVTCFAFGLLAVSLTRYLLPTAGESYRVAAIQPGVDMAFGNHETALDDLRRSIEPLLAKAGSSNRDLVVLPEGLADGRAMPPVTPFALPSMPIVVGGHRGVDPEYQSAFGYDGTWKWADKTRLVIFGEFVPGRDLFPFIAKAFSLPSGDMSAGVHGTQAFDLGGHRIGPIVCFEGLFPDIAYKQAMNGAQILTVISIDDWYLGTSAPDQLRAATTFRAAETGLPTVRAASLGYSLICDGKGRILEEAQIGQSAMIQATVEVPDRGGFPLEPILPLASGFFVLAFGLIRRPTQGAADAQEGRREGDSNP